MAEPRTSLISTRSSNNGIFKQYQQSMTSLVAEMRMMLGYIREESGNPSQDCKSYLLDINAKIESLEKEIKKIHDESAKKDEEIVKLKLQVKAAISDFSEMKSSLCLEIQQQKLVLNRAKQQFCHQKQSMQTTITQYLADIERKNQQIKVLKEDHQQQLQQLKSRIEGISLSSIKSYQQIQEEEEKSKLRLANIETQRQKTINTYSELITKQRQEIQLLAQKIQGNDGTNQSQQMLDLVKQQSQLMSQIQSLEAQIVQKDDQITKISATVKSQNKKSRQYYNRLKQQEQQIEQLKQKQNRLTRDYSNKQLQNTQLRNTLQKVVREREQTSKYMGTKWEHEIERVLLNAELEFDREKNRLKKAAQQRQQQIQSELMQKISRLKNELKGLKQIKTKLIEKVKQLEEKIRDLGQQGVKTVQKLKNQINGLIECKQNLEVQVVQLKQKLKQTFQSLEKSKKSEEKAILQLQEYKLSYQNRRNQLQLQAQKALQEQKQYMQQQLRKFSQASKKQLEQMVKKFQEQKRKKEKQQQIQLRMKEQSLIAGIEQIKRNQQQALKIKLLQVNEEKEDAKRQFQRALKSAKREYSEQNQQHIRQRTKLEKQIKQTLQTLKKKQQELVLKKENIEELINKNKDLAQVFSATVKQKDEQISIKQIINTEKGLRIQILQDQKSNIFCQYESLKGRYDTIRNEIMDIKQQMIKEHHYLSEQHDKIVKGYKSYIKQIEQNCFSHSDRMVYVREINKLKMINDSAETNLANAQSKLITLKQVAKYQVAKLQQGINKSDKFNATMRTQSRMNYSYSSGLSKRKGSHQRQKFQKYQDNNHHQSNQNIDVLSGFDTGNTGYEKLSNQKKRLGGCYQKSRSRLKKASKVGFTEIDTYSILSSSKKQFRLNTLGSLTSPHAIRYVRSALQK